MESYGFEAVRDAGRELVVQIERELVEQGRVIQALGECEEKIEEKIGETISEEQIKKEDVHMEDRPSVAPMEASEASGAFVLEGGHTEIHESSQPQAESALSAPATPTPRNCK